MNCPKCGSEVVDEYAHRSVLEYYEDDSGELRLYRWQCPKKEENNIKCPKCGGECKELLKSLRSTSYKCTDPFCKMLEFVMRHEKAED